jgi:YD repeat-containing protein
VIATDAAGSTTNLYDNLGRLTEVLNAFGSDRIMVYDNGDRVYAAADQNGVITYMVYDDLSRLLSKEVNGAGTEHYGYTMNIAAPTSLHE